MAPMIQKAGNLTQQLAMAQTVLSEFAGTFLVVCFNLLHAPVFRKY